MDLVVTALLCVSAAILFYFLQKKPKNYPPGPKNWPILGSIPAMAVLPNNTPFEQFESLRQQYGDIVGFYIGTRPVILISGLDCVKEISAKDEFTFRPSLTTPQHGKNSDKKFGLFMPEGNFWKSQRRFTMRHLRDFGFGKQTMNKYIHDEVDLLFDAINRQMTKHPEQKDVGVDLLSILPSVAIHTLWYIISGKRNDLEDERFVELTNLILEFFRLGDITSPVPLLKFMQEIPIVNGKFKRQVEIGEKLNNFIKEEFDEHLETFDENHLRDFLDVYIKEMKEDKTGYFSEEQLLSLCADLFTAGTETTGSTVGFTVRYLIKYPEVQDKVREELYRVIGRDRLPVSDDIQSLPYCAAVLAESMRHSGITPIGPPRAPVNDTTFRGYFIPKRCMMIVNFRSVHMDKKHWGDPENFRPERFIDADGKFRKDEHLILFGTGTRMCLGEPFAKNSTFIFFTSLVQNYKMKIPQQGPKLSDKTLPGLTTAPAPYRVTFTKL